MTNKEQILQTALRLFAEQGFDRTPTSQIAREAGVSEGLIFRHYGSKAGLLEAIIQSGGAQVAETMQAYQRATEPRTAILEHIRDSFQLLRAQRVFWRLVHQLRHQPAVQQTAAAQIEAFNRQVAAQLTEHFQLLGAAQPEAEALLLFALIDGVAVQFLQLPEQYPLEMMQHFLIQKYQHGNFLGQP